MKTNGGESTRRGFLYLFLLLVVLWLCLVSSLQWQEVAAGVILSGLCAIILGKSLSGLGFPSMTPKKLATSLIYLLVLAKEIVEANLDVAYRVLHPRMPIRPGIVAIKTGLRQDIAKLILANSITLTPGTFTVDVIGDRLLVHWINVRGDDVETATKAIGAKFEKYLIRIFE